MSRKIVNVLVVSALAMMAVMMTVFAGLKAAAVCVGALSMAILVLGRRT